MTAHDDVMKRAMRLLTYHRQRIWRVTSSVVVLTVLITAALMVVSPKYVARTKLTLLPTRGEIGFASARPESWGLSPAALLGQTHIEALLSRSLAEEVARALLEKGPANLNGGFLGQVRRRVLLPLRGFAVRVVTLLNTGRWEAADPLRAMAALIQSRTRVQNVPGSFVFQVAVTWENPEMAARVANLLTERYVAITLRASQEELRVTREYLEQRLKETQAELEKVTAAIRDFRTREQLYDAQLNASTDVDYGLQDLSQYLRDYNTTRAAWAQLDARINALKPYQTPAALAAFEAERIGLKTRLEELEKVIDDQLAKLDKLPAKEAGLRELLREQMTKERAVTALQDRLLDTRVAEAAQLSTARVIDPAIPPLYPERPLLIRNAVASVLVGLLLSLGLVVLTESRRPIIRCREDLGADATRVLGLVPYIAANLADRPDEEASEGIGDVVRGLVYGRYGTAAQQRTFRRHLEHLVQRLTELPDGRMVMLLSARPGEGKTFLIERLTFAARETGRRVLVVDANLQAPALHRAFGKSVSAGLAEALRGETSLKDVVVSTRDGVDLICAGTKGLVQEARWNLPACRAELRQLAQQYDLTLIDSAAVRTSPSAIRLASLADHLVGVLDVTRATRDDWAVLQEAVASSRALLALLNKVFYQPDYFFGGEEAAARG